MGASLSLPKESDPQLGLPDWGPYGKNYVGLSHLADKESGHRWDFYLMPGYHRRAVIGPYALREERWRIWKVKPDLSTYQLRYELEWKDQVYVDLTVQETGQNSRKLMAHCVNRTDLPQSVDLHFAASLTPNPVSGTKPVLPEKAVWVPALDYQRIDMPGQEHRQQQVTDGMRAGECYHPLTTNGHGVGAQYLVTPGSVLDYEFTVESRIERPLLVLRYHRWSDDSMKVRLTGCVEAEVDLPYLSDGMEQVALDLAPLCSGQHRLQLDFLVGKGLVFDGFALVEKEQYDMLQFVSRAPRTVPHVNWQEQERVLSLAYVGIESSYRLEFPSSVALRRRSITGDDVPGIVSAKANDSVHVQWKGLGGAHTELVSLGPVSLEPQREQTLEVEIGLGGDGATLTSPVDHSSTWSSNIDYPTPYQLGMEILAANTLGNVVFPVRRQDQWIQHYSPGRAWDCLYTWDSGMLGVGLTVFSPQRAAETLHQYLLPVGNPDAAYLEHGTPLPIQVYQALEIWNRTHDQAFLAWAYPRLRQFYEFLAGRSHGSVTDRFATGLLQTWDYNYNSGGWDDYPPQHELIQYPERRRMIAPAVTTSHVIRFAKILSQFALELGEEAEAASFNQDVERWSKALQMAWDDEAGYFSYFEHDSKGDPLGFYRHSSGENFNRGLDGVSPLVTGELNMIQVDRLLDHLFNPEELWSEIGFSTVSRTAAYYDDAGYWNGAMWIPHQWFLWKTLLDQGKGDFAWKLAEALLKCWEREAAATYQSFELFRIKTGRGAGWHQFSGLSAPLLAIHAAYFEPGLFTAGYNTWVGSTSWSEDGKEFIAELKIESSGLADVLLVPLVEGMKVESVVWRDQAVDVKPQAAPAVDIGLSRGEGRLVVRYTNG